MKNKRGDVAVVAIIIVIVAITAGVVGWMFAKKSQESIQKEVAMQGVVSIQQDGDVESNQNKVLLYQNDEFGFTLNFSKNWEGYKVQKSTKEADGYRFTFTDPTEKCSFPILLSTIKKWEDCKSGKNPNAFYWCGRELSRSENYVFYPASNPPDCANENLVKEIGAIIGTLKLTSDATVDLQTYTNAKYMFEFKYPKEWSLIKEFQPSLSDFLPSNRSFVAIYPNENRQDFSARVDVYDLSLAIVKRDNPFLKNLTSSVQIMNGISWTRMGDANYLTERNGKTYNVSGRGDLISQIVSTFKFTN